MFRFFIIALLLVSNVYAVGFVIPDGVTETTTQTMADNGDVGIVEAGGAIVVNGAAVAMTDSNQTLENGGLISSVSAPNHVVSLVSAPNSTVNNTGSIESDLAGYGIQVSSSPNVIVNNSGVISTTAFNIDAIRAAASSGLMINNSGTITTSGLNAFGITFLTGTANSQIYNSGSIATTGDNSYGVWFSEGINNRVYNSGLITTQGSGAHGIRLSGAQVMAIENSGTIAVTGASADAIHVADGNKTVTNCGIISSENGHAISFDGTNNMLVLTDCGSQHSLIQGSVITTGDALNVNVETNSNLILTLDDGGLGFANVSSNNPYVIIGNTLVVVDRALFTAQADILADLSDGVLGGIYKGRFGFGSCCQQDCGCSV